MQSGNPTTAWTATGSTPTCLIEEACMTDVSRRAFLTRVSVVGVGAAAVATGLGSVTGAADAAEARRSSDGQIEGPVPQHDVFLHIRDAKTGEVAIIAGTSEHVFRDRKLVASVLRTFNQSTKE
jgi:hypothetical protein